MKLNDKTNRYFLGVSLVVFTLGGILFYLLFQDIIDRDFNKRLHERKEYYIEVFSQSDSLLHYQQFSANSICIIPVPGFSENTETISDTVIFDRIENKFNRYRQVSFNMKVRDQSYRIQVRRALVERKDIIQGVVILEALLFIAFVVTLSLLNSQLSKTLWKPFYNIVDTINNYKADRPDKLNFEKGSITEFNELASVIAGMTERIHGEFYILKEFTENASHEIQTPLAIVKNKLEILLQSPGLTEDQMELINAASLAATRLSKLNEALLILSRIENRQFHTVEDIPLNERIDRQVKMLEELIGIKGIGIETKYQNDLHFKMNPYLADILLENLIVNSIKHNKPSGLISLAVKGSVFTISNSGERPLRDPAELFNRFIKSNARSQSLGLGLSIVKAICDTYQYPVSYFYSDGTHHISIDFSAKGLL